MKDSATYKRKSGLLIVKNLIILLVIVIAAFVGSRSWFSHSLSATANGVSVETKMPEKLEIAIVPHGETEPSMSSNKWGSSSVTLNATNYPDLFDSLYLSDIDGGIITGSGASRELLFKKPFMKQEDLIAKPDTTQFSSWETAVANTDYLCVDIYARVASTAASTGAQLKSTSYIKPNTDFARGSFSADGVVGAVRFGFLSKSSSSNAMKIWIPAPHVHYDDDADVVNFISTTATFTIPCGSTGNGKTHYYYNGSSTAAVEYPAADTIAGTTSCTLGSDVNLVYFGTTTSEYKWGMTTCYLWIEGEDTEARLNTVGGKFKISLDFASY